MLLKILGGVLALALGIFLGLSFGKGPTVEEVDERMGKNLPRERATRHFTFLGLMQKKQQRGRTDAVRGAAGRSTCPTRPDLYPTRRVTSTSTVPMMPPST